MTDAEELFDAVREEVGTVVVGNEDVLEGLTVALLTGGHVLIEGVPGMGKTTIANGFARATGLDYSRVQMTPDVLPADVTGTHVYRDSTDEFVLQRGPVFANLVLVDEINRAMPKTQSGLLEAMQERQVTLEGETLALPEPFMVVATQNSVEMEGVFELPEAQRDRFQQRLVIGTPDSDDERRLLDLFDAAPDLGPEVIDRVVTREEFSAARETVSHVYVDEKVKEYILALVQTTRDLPDIQRGASTRAMLSLLRTSKARAAIRGRDYVTPDDVKVLARPVLAHRLALSTDAELNRRTTDELLDSVLESVDPAEYAVAEGESAAGTDANSEPGAVE